MSSHSASRLVAMSANESSDFAVERGTGLLTDRLPRGAIRRVKTPATIRSSTTGPVGRGWRSADRFTSNLGLGVDCAGLCATYFDAPAARHHLTALMPEIEPSARIHYRLLPSVDSPQYAESWAHRIPKRSRLRPRELGGEAPHRMSFPTCGSLSSEECTVTVDRHPPSASAHMNRTADRSQARPHRRFNRDDPDDALIAWPLQKDGGTIGHRHRDTCVLLCAQLARQP
jgi:hypothetical protein